MILISRQKKRLCGAIPLSRQIKWRGVREMNHQLMTGQIWVHDLDLEEILARAVPEILHSRERNWRGVVAKGPITDFAF